MLATRLRRTCARRAVSAKPRQRPCQHFLAGVQHCIRQLVQRVIGRRIHVMEFALRQCVLSLPYALRFLLATDPDALTMVFGAPYRVIFAHLLETAGVTRSTGHAGAVMLIQRFGSALNQIVHFHMILLDGVYLPVGDSPPVFRHVPAPTRAQLQLLVQQIADRIGRLLEKRGLVERDMENAWLITDGPGGPLDDLIGHSITYRFAVSPRAG
jgi:Putative transposase